MRIRQAVAASAGAVAVACSLVGCRDSPEAAAPSTSAAPAAAPTVPSTTTPAGVPMTTAFAFLHVAPQPTVQSTQPPTAMCASLVDAGWASDECGVTEMARGTRVWLVERKLQPPAVLWRAKVVTWNQGKGAWLVDLQFANDEGVSPGKLPAVDLVSINVKAADLTGDGKAELVFGYRANETGAYLSYDIVTDSPAGGPTPTVAANRQGLAKGQVAVANGVITEYATPPAGTPSLPTQFDKSIVQYAEGEFRLVPSGAAPVPGPGQLDL